MRYTVIIILVALLSGSCDNWLNLEPENERLSMDYWTKKEDVHKMAEANKAFAHFRF